MALAVAVRAGEHRHRAGRMHAHLAGLEQAGARTERAGDVRRRDAAGLDVAGVAEAALHALGRRGGLARGEALHVGHLERLVEVRRVVADVVGEAHRRRVRKRGDEVLPADGGRVHLHVARALLDQALDDVGGLRPAGAAIGIDRHGVGEHRLHVDVDRRRLVLAGEQGRVEDGGHRRREGRQVRAHVGDRVGPKGEEVALCVHRHLGCRDVVATMRIREEGFAALRRPLDRLADVLAGPDQSHVFGIEKDLRAEAAADVGRDHAHLRFRQAQHEGAHQQALDVRVLVGDVERVALVRLVVAGVGGTWLHRVRDQPVVDELELGDVRRLRERRLHRRLVAVAPVVADVVRHLVVHGRADRGRRLDVDDRRQLFVVDLDQLGRVLGLQIRLGHDQRDLVADVAHLALRQHRMAGLLHRRAVLAVDQPAAGQAADLGVGQVGASEDVQHAGRLQRRVELDGADARMRVRRAQEDGVGLAVQRHVVGVLAVAGEKALVFAPAQALADGARLDFVHVAHVVLLRPRRAWRPTGRTGST